MPTGNEPLSVGGLAAAINAAGGGGCPRQTLGR